MTVELKALQEKRTRLAGEIRKFADEAEKRTKEGKEAFDAEQRKNYDTLNADYDATMAEITRHNEAMKIAERRAQLDNDDQSPINRGDFNPRENRDRPHTGDEAGNGDERRDRALAFQAWTRSANDMPLSDEHRAACKRVGVNPRSKYLDFRMGDTDAYKERQEAFRGSHFTQSKKRALSVGTANAGGSTVPESFLAQLEVSMLAFNGIEPYATVILTDNGQDMPMPTMNDTANEGEIIGENTENNSADPATGSIDFKAFKFSSKFIKLSYELLEDSAINFGTLAGQIAGERIGRIAEKRFTTGTGTGQPQGIVTAAGVGVTAAGQTAITADELIDLQHSVDPAYRTGPSVGFMMHDSVIKYVRKLKDSEGRYLWQSGLAFGVPDTFLGQLLAVNQNMASSIAAAAKTVLYGDLSKFMIRRVRTVRLKRLDERFADLDQVGFIMFVRQDGRLLDAGTDPVKVLQQAAAE